jgi:hypothetical protein
MEAFLTKLVEERGKDFNNKKWFSRNERYFESFENRGQKVWTLSKYGKRVLEMIKSTPKNINESVGLFKSEIFESVKMEEFLAEGALASKGHSIGVYLGEMEPEDSDWQDLYDKIAETLGEDINDVIVVDSETNEDDPLSAKVYNYLSSHFTGKEAVETPKFKNSNHGSFQMYDPKLNVVRLDDYGFVAFYFTTSSKF